MQPSLFWRRPDEQMLRFRYQSMHSGHNTCVQHTIHCNKSGFDQYQKRGKRSMPPRHVPITTRAHLFSGQIIILAPKHHAQVGIRGKKCRHSGHGSGVGVRNGGLCDA
jgi:hypothetical protein